MKLLENEFERPQKQIQGKTNTQLLNMIWKQDRFVFPRNALWGNPRFQETRIQRVKKMKIDKDSS